MIREKKKIKEIATQIVELEKLCQRGVDVPENMNKMAKLTSDLTFEELLAVDDYITKKNILTN